MTPTEFPEQNCTFKRPSDMEECQCREIPAYRGEIQGGSCDGFAVVVVAWRPSADDIRAINCGQPIHLAMLGGLAPHIMGTDFHNVTHPS